MEHIFSTPDDEPSSVTPFAACGANNGAQGFESLRTPCAL